MKNPEFTKKITLEIPESTKTIIDGTKLERYFNNIIMQYRKHSNHMDANTVERVKNALLSLPDLYLYSEE